MPLARQTLIHETWPDKALYGAVLLLVAGFLGLLHGLLATVDKVEYPNEVPAWVRDYPGWLTLLLSGAAALLALVSLRRRDTRVALVGAAAGVASLGLLLLESVVSLVAAGFLVRSHFEREYERPGARGLTARMWPDKSLAASLLMVVLGLLTMGWWVGQMGGWLDASGFEDAPWWLASAGIAVGGACLVAGWLLYYQRGPGVAAAAALGGLAGGALFIVGPALAIAVWILLGLAWREKEFQQRIVP